MNFERISILLKQVRFVQIGLLFLLLNGVLLVLVVLPEARKISVLQADYANNRSRLVQESEETKRTENRLASLQKAQSDLKTIYTKILSDKKTGVPAIREELEQLASSLSVDRQSVSYQYDLLPEFGLRHFVLSVPVEGAYRDIRKFINGIERSEHFLILDRVNLSAEKSPGAGDHLLLNFQLSTYLTDEELKNNKYETRKSVSRP
jgi:Tfp pilus assembly protein PilO